MNNNLTAKDLKANVGKYLICNMNGEVLRIQDTLTNGLGLNYKILPNCRLKRVIGN